MSEEPASRSADFVDDAVVVLVGFDRELVLPPGLSLERVADLEGADRVLDTGPVGVVAIGPRLLREPGGADACLRFLEHFDTRHPFQKPSKLIFGLRDRAALQALVQEDRVFYAGPEQLAEGELARLVGAAFEDFRRRQILQLAAAPSAKDRRAVVTRRLFTTAENLLQCTDLEAAAEPVSEALVELIAARDVKLWLYDPLAHVLREIGPSGLEVSAVTSLTSFAARTGHAVQCRDMSEDARHDPEVDGAGGSLLAAPVLGPEQQVLGVLSCVRQDGEVFEPPDRDIVERLAGHLSPLFALYAPRTMEAALSASAQGSDAELFRREAIEAQAHGFSERGRVLQNTGGWTEWTWMVLLTGFVTAGLFLLLGRMHDYAAGPAVIRVGQRVDVSAPADAAVVRIDVEPLEQVVAGQPLLRLDGAPQASQIADLEEAFEQRLRQRLADPADPAVEAAVIDVRTRLEEARTRLDQRTVRAPIGGVVGDVRVRPGQHPALGELLLSIIADADERTVTALIPGHFGPQLEAGQRLRLTLQGYADLPLELSVLDVGEEVISPREARQALGRSIADAVPLEGPVVLVRAELREQSFSDGRRALEFTHGMQGRAEIRVRSRPILLHLVPGLDTAMRGWRD